MTALQSGERALTYTTGWLAVTFLVVAVLAPLVQLVRRPRSRRRVGRWHDRLGWVGAGIAAVHSLASITRGAVPVLAEVGLWVAGVAAVLIGLEVLLGCLLRTPRVSSRWRVRRDHVRLAPVVGALVAAHVVLNWHYVVPR